MSEIPTNKEGYYGPVVMYEQPAGSLGAATVALTRRLTPR